MFVNNTQVTKQSQIRDIRNFQLIPRGISIDIVNVLPILAWNLNFDVIWIPSCDNVKHYKLNGSFSSYRLYDWNASSLFSQREKCIDYLLSRNFVPIIIIRHKNKYYRYVILLIIKSIFIKLGLFIEFYNDFEYTLNEFD